MAATNTRVHEVSFFIIFLTTLSCSLVTLVNTRQTHLPQRNSLWALRLSYMIFYCMQCARVYSDYAILVSLVVLSPLFFRTQVQPLLFVYRRVQNETSTATSMFLFLFLFFYVSACVQKVTLKYLFMWTLFKSRFCC